MEELKPARKNHLGLEDPPFNDVKPHEFSLSWIKFLCRNSIKTFKRLDGSTVIRGNALEVSILNNLGPIL
jgi:hypothetical protein